MPTVYFYRQFEKPYGCFSNFYNSKMTIDGEEWPTVEHYYQAQKFPHRSDIREEIRGCRNTMDTKRLANEKYRSLYELDWWKTVCDNVMLKALRAKYSQSPELGALLLSTAGNELAEHTGNDSYWADGGDGTGKNMLGKLLMVVREELQKSTIKGKEDEI